MLMRTASRPTLVGLLACTLAALPGVAATPAAAGPAARITVVDLGTLGGRESTARDVNERGQVVGDSLTADGERHAFLWEDGVMHDLGTLGGDESIAWAVNDAGQVVGRSLDANGLVRPFLWEDGQMHEIDARPGERAEALLVNERGQVVVGFGAPDSVYQLWEDGTLTDIHDGEAYIRPDALNDQGWVVGERTGRAHWDGRARLWQDGVVTDLGPADDPEGFSRAVDVNEAGQVAGSLPAPGGAARAAIWQDGDWTLLGDLGGWSSVSDINEHGTAAGSAADGSSGSNAVLFRDGEVIDLHELAPGWSRSRAVRLNDREQVVGDVSRAPHPEVVIVRAALWQDGEMHVLPELDAQSNTSVVDITENGLIVGNAGTGWYSDDLGGYNDEHAVLWTVRGRS